jgi:hypothetical protein
MIVCTIGNSPPPPIPCKARPRMSTHMAGASPQATEPTTKMLMDSSRIVRRPWISESLPNSGVVAVAARR